MPVCSVCGNSTFRRSEILWRRLIDEWQLTPDEVAYVNRQQGEQCTSCNSNLRSVVLADALRAVFGTTDTFKDFVASSKAQDLAVLEINKAGMLHPHLARMKGNVFGAYPELDMHALPYRDDTFDAVVHSDTLEHVSNPIHALGECRRVLKTGGALCFTVPIIVGRTTRSRGGLPMSFHGTAATEGEDWAVQTEFGSDAWLFVIRAGFTNVRLTTLEFPAAVAITAIKTDRVGE